MSLGLMKKNLKEEKMMMMQMKLKGMIIKTKRNRSMRNFQTENISIKLFSV